MSVDIEEFSQIEPQQGRLMVLIHSFLLIKGANVKFAYKDAYQAKLKSCDPFKNQWFGEARGGE